MTRQNATRGPEAGSDVHPITVDVELVNVPVMGGAAHLQDGNPALHLPLELNVA
jgi:hypothetical protein